MSRRRAIGFATPQLIDVVTALVREHGRQPTVDEIARGCHLPVLFLRRKWREAGRPLVRQVIVHVRMMEAARQLDEGHKVEAVMLSLGYRSYSNFARQFKETFLETPGERRRRASSLDMPRRS